MVKARSAAAFASSKVVAVRDQFLMARRAE
jgi:hypothetical protein